MQATSIPDTNPLQNWPLVERNGYRYPPGLRHNLPLYLGRGFFRPGNPILLFEHLAARFGPVSHYRIATSDVIVLNEPEFIREVLVNQASSFIKERTQRRMKILLGEGLITSEGEMHRHQRKLIAPAFHRQRIQNYASSIVELASACEQEWRRGEVIDSLSAMMSLSLQVVARTLLNTEVSPAVESINREVNAIMDLYNILVALPRAEAYLHLPIPGLMRFRRARRRLDAVVHGIIAQHRSGPDSGDLLSMLLRTRDPETNDAAMSDEQLRDEVLTIFLAGYETVANSLAWTWLLLAQNPRQEATLHAELDEQLGGRLPTFDDLPRLRYTEMVLAESMRLYPPAWAMGRQAIRDVEIGPYRLPAGTYFFFSQYIIQRDSRFYTDPLRFDPERFTPEQKATRSRFEYFPFGAGGRQCIGESFAWMEAILILATLAQRWRLRLLPGQRIQLQPKITLRPKHGLRMQLEPRGPAIC